MSREPLSHGLTPDIDARDRPQTAGSSGDSGAPLELWSWLPRLSGRSVRLEASLARWSHSGGVIPFLQWLRDRADETIELGPPQLVARPTGLRRPGLIAQLRWPSLHTRLALGLEVPLAHAVVDALLGYDRPFAESRLQLTPVEWGVWSYLAVRAIDQLASGNGPNLLLDRVGPDPFDPLDLGAVSTILWPLRVGSTTGTARLWLPESVLDLAASTRPSEGPGDLSPQSTKAGELASLWHARAGFVAMPLGLHRLRKGGVLPLTDSWLTGTPQSPSGPVDLVCDESVAGLRFSLAAEPVPGSGGRMVRLTDSLRRDVKPREPLSPGINQHMNTNDIRATDRGGIQGGAPAVSPADVPVTLTVELGRVNLTLSRLADLKAGDVIELGRHSREPVELTSNGRLVARGELLLIDTELGVRVTHVFL
jgi:type III secretion system YscQ/HrcQ family protein